LINGYLFLVADLTREECISVREYSSMEHGDTDNFFVGDAHRSNDEEARLPSPRFVAAERIGCLGNRTVWRAAKQS
jgi:hypothetical protein